MYPLANHQFLFSLQDSCIFLVSFCFAHPHVLVFDQCWLDISLGPVSQKILEKHNKNNLTGVTCAGTKTKNLLKMVWCTDLRTQLNGRYSIDGSFMVSVDPCMSQKISKSCCNCRFSQRSVDCLMDHRRGFVGPQFQSPDPT